MEDLCWRPEVHSNWRYGGCWYDVMIPRSAFYNLGKIFQNFQTCFYFHGSDEQFAPMFKRKYGGG
jgi:hypothetical protein